MGHFASYYKSKLSYVPFVPTDIAGCQLWLKADAGITKDGSNYVSEWLDQSGNGNNATQGTALEQPIWIDNRINGYPAVNFTDNKCIDFSSINIKNGQSFFVVWKKNSGTYAPTFHNNSIEYFVTEVGGSIYIRDGSYIDFPINISNYNTLSVILTTNGIKVYVNGIQIQTEKTLLFDAIFTSFGLCNIFASGNVDYAEMIHYDTELSDANRQLVENYINTKYALW